MVKRHENVLGVRDDTGDDGSSRKPKKTAPAGLRRKRELSQHPRDQANREKYRQDQEAKTQTQRKKIYVGVDLGTTYTGVGYLTGVNPGKDVSIIHNWGRGRETFQDKVPSVIGYAEDNNTYGGKRRWGYQVKAGDKSYSWWKLLLDDDFEPEKWDDPELRKCMGDGVVRLPEGKTAQDVASDYLRFVYKHIFNQLAEQIGEQGLDVSPIDFCLTVPATWSHAARDRTREAARIAGFGTRPGDEVLLIDEPQAAILEVLYSAVNTYKADVLPFKQGSILLTADLGGGTIDLISYRVVRLEPSLRLEEAAIGIGAKAGASTVDRNFWAWLERTFGTAFTDLPLHIRANGSAAMSEFEKLKQEFIGAHSPEQEQDLRVRLKMKKVDMDDENVSRHYDDQTDEICFTPKEMQSWFQPILDAGFELIRDQIESIRLARMTQVDTIVLAGGLAANKWIEHSFQKFAQLHGINCRIPKRAWSAVCRGAALSAYDRQMIVSRRSRDNLGFIVHEAFQDGVHLEEDRLELASGSVRAKNQMRWPIRRGMKITKSTTFEIPLYTEFENKQLKRRVLASQQIFTNIDDQPPSRLDDDACSLLGTLKMDLTRSFNEERKRLKNEDDSDSETTKLDVKVKVAVGHDKGVLVWRAVTGMRKQVGSVELEYCSEPGAGKKRRKR